MFIAALHITVRTGNNLDAYQQENGFKKCTFTPWSTTQLLNREKHREICRHMGGTSKNKNKKQKVYPE